MRLTVVGKQRGRLGRRLEDHVTAVATGSTRRLAPGPALLAVERGNTSATIATLDVDSNLVDEHRAQSPRSAERRISRR